ncbi:hypothetical protein AB1Y20_012671 [Prymnesium parvum]|uniref:Fe2OG dioxygenase domain-containing protein n=1 Tax=Prymnesium parvum TaxID=97485 RepID=A0AB34IKI9_PRYPA
MAPLAVSRASSLEELRVDESRRLAAHLLLIREDTLLQPSAAAPYWQHRHPAMEVLLLSGSLAQTLLPAALPASLPADGVPSLGCLERGLARGLVTFATVRRPAPGAVPSEEQAHAWVTKACESIEVGFINYLPVSVTLLWVAPSGELQHQADLPARCKLSILGQECIHWRNSLVGHRFQLRPNLLDAAPVLVSTFYSGVQSIGEPEPLPQEVLQRNWTEIVEQTSARERARARNVHRTFTEVGFDRAPIPEEVWASMSAYYYNNRHSAQREDWDVLSDRVFVNWWQSPTLVIPMPPALKASWQDRLLPAVSQWAGGVELEPTSLYGMRVYQNGSWLLRHVDREQTHALSAIMNLDQAEGTQPWPLHIDSIGGATHSLTLSPGEMLFYESARCLHGRPQPLRGARFVNAFVHFRPRGNPNWYVEEGGFSGNAVRWAAEHVARRSEEGREIARRIAAHAGLVWSAAAPSPSASAASLGGAGEGAAAWARVVLQDALMGGALFACAAWLLRRLGASERGRRAWHLIRKGKQKNAAE